MAWRCRLFGLGLAVALVVACGAEPQPPMRVGAVLWPGNESLFFAASRGWLVPRDFRMVETSRGSETIRALRNGTIDAAALTLDEVVRAMHDGVDPVLLLLLDESHGADAVLARPGLASLADLRGKRIGLQVNSVSAYLLRRALEVGQLRPDEVQIVNVAPDLHEAFLARGEVDAVATHEPFRSQLLGAGATELFNSKAIPGEITDVLVVHRDYLEAHPQRAADLHHAWHQARLQAATADSVAGASARLGLSEPAFASMLAGLTIFDAPETEAVWLKQRERLLVDMTFIQARLAEAGLISKRVPIEPLFQWPERLAARIWRR